MSNIVRFARPERPRIKTCQTCRYAEKGTSATSLWTCGACCTYCDFAIRHSGECGPERALWEPRSPSFWVRLGDAIITRIKGQQQ